MSEQPIQSRTASSVFQSHRPEDVLLNNRAVARELWDHPRNRSNPARALQLSKLALGDLVSDLIGCFGGLATLNARAEHAAARAVFDAAGSALGVASVSLINLIDPTALVLGGRGAAWADLLLPAMREQLEERAYPFLDWGAQLPILIAPEQPYMCLEVAECVLKAIQLAEIPIPAVWEAAMT